MAGTTNQIATALAADAAAVAGIQGSSPVPLDTIPNTPYVAIDSTTGALDAGSWETVVQQYLMRVYVARTATAAIDKTTLNDLHDLFIAQFRAGITEGVAGVSEALIKSWNLDRYYKVGDELYAAIDYVVNVEVDRAATYTP